MDGSCATKESQPMPELSQLRQILTKQGNWIQTCVGKAKQRDKKSAGFDYRRCDMIGMRLISAASFS
jgi:hypothetical protein